jgi:hypothetical protein
MCALRRSVHLRHGAGQRGASFVSNSLSPLATCAGSNLSRGCYRGASQLAGGGHARSCGCVAGVCRAPASASTRDTHPAAVGLQATGGLPHDGRTMPGGWRGAEQRVIGGGGLRRQPKISLRHVNLSRGVRGLVQEIGSGAYRNVIPVGQGVCRTWWSAATKAGAITEPRGHSSHDHGFSRALQLPVFGRGCCVAHQAKTPECSAPGHLTAPSHTAHHSTRKARLTHPAGGAG